MGFKKCQGTGCGAEIVFVKTFKGSMPINADTYKEGDETFDRSRHTPHFTTCKDADNFKREAGERRAVTRGSGAVLSILIAMLFNLPALAEEPTKPNTIEVKVLTIETDLDTHLPPYECIYGLVFKQEFKRPGDKKVTKLFYYQLLEEGKPGKIVCFSEKLPGKIADRTNYKEQHPGMARFGDRMETYGKFVPVGQAAGGYFAGSLTNN